LTAFLRSFLLRGMNLRLFLEAEAAHFGKEENYKEAFEEGELVESETKRLETEQEKGFQEDNFFSEEDIDWQEKGDRRQEESLLDQA
jgi:hypothetical protein